MRVRPLVWAFVVATLAVAASLPVPTAAAATGSPPNPPTSTVATAGSGQVTLRWAAPFYTNGTITGYAVTPSTGGSALSPVTFASTATTEVVGGLANGSSYTFTVAAINASGTSAASTPSAAITVGAPAPPAFPTAVPGDGSAAVRWLTPTGNASAVTGYAVTPSRDGVAQPVQTFASTATVETVVGLVDGSHYTFAVAAINASGTGLASTSAAIVVGSPVAPKPPTAPWRSAGPRRRRRTARPSPATP